MEIDLSACGQRIYQIRKKHHCSMARFAKLLGNTSASTINNWEKGNNLPKTARLEQLALLGNTTVNWLLYGDFNQYVYDLLRSLKQEQLLTKEQLIHLGCILKKKQVSYSQDLVILSTAKELFPEAFQPNYPESYSSADNQAMVAESFMFYEIETHDNYRLRLLPLIEESLATSSENIITDLLEQFLLFLTTYRLEKKTYTHIVNLLSLLVTSSSLPKKRQPSDSSFDLEKHISSDSQKTEIQWNEFFKVFFEKNPS